MLYIIIIIINIITNIQYNIYIYKKTRYDDIAIMMVLQLFGKILLEYLRNYLNRKNSKFQLKY